MDPEVVPLAPEHLPAAAALLAERHRRHRLSAPLLAARYEEPDEATAELEALLAQPGAAGVMLVRGGEPAGYLIGARRADEIWGANVWIEPAGHAAREAEEARDLYAAAAAAWVREGRTRHYAVVPATDASLIDAWFRLGFGQQHAIAVAPVPEDASPGRGTREAGAGDVEALAGLSPLLDVHQAASPVFSGLPTENDPNELRREVAELLGEPGRTTYVAEEKGRLTGAVYLAPCEASSQHAGLARPDRAGLLAWIVVRPEARGGGAGLALTQTAFSWARARGYEALAIDWRATNLLASRFWPRRGFRPTFLRLYRSIP